MGEYYVNKSDLVKAQSYFSEAIKDSASKGSQQQHSDQGQIAITNGNKEEAEKYFIMMNEKTEWKDEEALKVLGFLFRYSKL